MQPWLPNARVSIQLTRNALLTQPFFFTLSFVLDMSDTCLIILDVQLVTACVDPRYLRSQWLFLDVRRASIPRDWDSDWLQDTLLSRGCKRVNKMVSLSGIQGASTSRAPYT